MQGNWKGLGFSGKYEVLYMVFALGSIDHTTSDSIKDVYYYMAAKFHVGYNGFGNRQIKTLQALILIAGLYLH